MQDVIQNSAQQGTEKYLAAMGAKAEEICNEVVKAVLKVCEFWHVL